MPKAACPLILWEIFTVAYMGFLKIWGTFQNKDHSIYIYMSLYSLGHLGLAEAPEP